MSFSTVFAVIVLFGVVASGKSYAPAPNTKFWQPSYQINGTTLVDNVMETVRSEVINAGLDEINPPNVAVKFFNQSFAIRNQSIKGMANAYRVGDVVVNITIFSTKFRSAFAVYNVSSDADVEIHTNNMNYSNGHVHMDCNNVTAYQVFKLSHLTQSLTLDEFELTVDDCNFNATGLGERASNGSGVVNEVFDKVKDPLLKVFSAGFKIAINAALTAARGALLG